MDAVQTARRLVTVTGEFSARIQGAKDDLKCGFAGVLGMRVGRNTTPVVTHGNMAIGMQFNFDPCGVARDSLVHRIVDDFRDHVVQRAIVLAANVHAGTQAHVFHILKDLDRRRIVFWAWLPAQ